MTYNVFKHFSHRWVCISSFDEHSIFCVFCKFGLSLLKKPFRSLGFGLSATINSQLKTHLLKRSTATRGARSSYKWETPRPKQDAGLPPPPSRFPRPTLTPAARTRLSSPLAALPPLTPPGPARPWQPHAQLPPRHIRHPGRREEAGRRSTHAHGARPKRANQPEPQHFRLQAVAGGSVALKRGHAWVTWLSLGTAEGRYGPSAEQLSALSLQYVGTAAQFEHDARGCHIGTSSLNHDSFSCFLTRYTTHPSFSKVGSFYFFSFEVEMHTFPISIKNK